MSGTANGTTLYLCSGDNLTLDWAYTLSHGETVHDIEWLYDGHSNEVIAIQTHGHFLPGAPFSHRVEQSSTTNAGLQLTHLLVGDSGLYSVEVTYADDTGFQHTLLTTVHIVVADDLMTQDTHLHASQSQTAVKDDRGDWAVELECGQFIFGQSTPPRGVQWKTPSGSLVSSTKYENGFFSLLVPPTQLEAGAYSCQVSAQDDHTCLRGNTDAKASVVVDAVSAR